MVIRTETEYEKAINYLMYINGIIVGQNISDKDFVNGIIRRTTYIYDILYECIQNSQDYQKETKEGD